MIWAGTGSRSFNCDACYGDLLGYIGQQNLLEGDLTLISGMSEGWDEAIARAAIELSIPFIAAIPNKTYGRYYWGEHSQTGRNRLNDFNNYLMHAQEVVYVCRTVFEGGVHSNFVRNQWMVDHGDFFLVWGSSTPGTRDCIGRIRSASKPSKVFHCHH